MKSSSIRLCVVTLSLLSVGVLSHAQRAQPNLGAQQPQPVMRQLTREQQAALDKEDYDVAQLASIIIKTIDENKVGEVWDTASPLAKRIISRDDVL
jgi:hypothetical protein